MDAIEKKCHGSHSKDRKDKYKDKYMGKTKTETDKDKNVGIPTDPHDTA